ncbi:MAG: TetR/AcrR family transcriptional regulator, partial [Firmicutes bacterium]|nr:TetR/AcrR family transcriptional regulator [Bacillota bacterium]
MDRRVIKTKRAIKKAFFALLVEKDLNDISVTDISRIAEINRKTFYNYYTGVFQLVDELENEILSKLDATLKEI